MFQSKLILGCLLALVATSYTHYASAYNLADFTDFSLRDGFNNLLLPGRLYVPPEAATGPRPLMVFLHGGGADGTNNLSQIDQVSDGMIDAAKTRGAYLYVPQTTDNWGSVTRTAQVMTMIDRAVTSQHADTSRLYVTGFSNGGGGTWNMLSRFDGRFAAAVEISGVNPASDFVVARLIDTPILALHARDDATAPVADSRNVISGILAAAHEPLPTYLPASNPSTFVVSNSQLPIHADFRELIHSQGSATDFLVSNPAIDLMYYEPAFGGHTGLTDAFSSPEMYDWMFAHSTAVPAPTAFTMLLLGATGANGIAQRRIRRVLETQSRSRIHIRQMMPELVSLSS